MAKALLTSSRAYTGLLVAVFALFVATVVAFAASVVPAPAMAYGSDASTATAAQTQDIDPETQAALQELEEAFAQAYAESQGISRTSSTVQGETISDDGTPLASYPGTTEEIADEDTPLAAAPGEAEVIEDDENPLAASPYAEPVYNFTWVLIAVFVIVTVVYAVLTRRLEKNIATMRRFVD